ncbi:MAG: hypothetical protein CMN28_13765 [Salinisphaeraceae bacterium]|nr:hypothetical protein [Salinisphaeraceae bacterium]
MKTQLRRFFAPVLNLFESDDTTLVYRKSHRAILLAVSALFLFLAIASLVAAGYSAGLDAFIPFLVFFAVGVVSGLVGLLGSDQAVARIWGSR